MRTHPSRPLLLSAGLTIVLAGGCDRPPSPDESAAPPVRAALNDGANAFLKEGDLAFDGSDRFLAVWTVTNAGGTEIAGQIFSRTTGAPLTPSRLYTSGGKGKHDLRAAFGGGRFLVTYALDYTPTDPDAMAFYVGTDGTPGREFGIANSASFETPGRAVWVPELSLFFGLFSDAPEASVGNIRGYYVNSSGNGSMGDLVSSFGRPDAAYGDGRIALVWRAPTNKLMRGELVPGELAVRNTQFIADSSDRPVLAFHPTRHRFVMEFAAGISSLFSKSWTANCTTSSCQSAIQEIISRAAFGIRTSGQVHLVPLGNNFLASFYMASSSTSGIATILLDDTGVPLNRHLPAVSADCPNPQPSSQGHAGAFSTGSSAVLGWRPGCPNAPHTYAVTVDANGNRTAMTPVAD